MTTDNQAAVEALKKIDNQMLERAGIYLDEHDDREIIEAIRAALTAQSKDATIRELVKALKGAEYAIKGREHTGFIDAVLAKHATTIASVTKQEGKDADNMS